MHGSAKCIPLTPVVSIDTSTWLATSTASQRLVMRPVGLAARVSAVHISSGTAAVRSVPERWGSGSRFFPCATVLSSAWCTATAAVPGYSDAPVRVTAVRFRAHTTTAAVLPTYAAPVVRTSFGFPTRQCIRHDNSPPPFAAVRRSARSAELHPAAVRGGCVRTRALRAGAAVTVGGDHDSEPGLELHGTIQRHSSPRCGCFSQRCRSVRNSRVSTPPPAHPSGSCAGVLWQGDGASRLRAQPAVGGRGSPRHAAAESSDGITCSVPSKRDSWASRVCALVRRDCDASACRGAATYQREARG